MGKARTHISVNTKTYERAKQIMAEYRLLGMVLTMEEAFYKAKQEERESSSVNVVGWRL